MTTMHILSSTTTANKITHLFHFADIHIRNGDMDRSRYHEYREVFHKALQRMDDMACVTKDHTAITILAGDIFHHKGRMDTPALKLYFWWIDQLLSRTPVLLICGNHDFRQEDPKQPDMLETMILPFQHRKTRHPLYYLQESGHYVYANIGFGVVSVKDTLRSGSTSGIVKNLPAFPCPTAFEGQVEYKMALFHGTISQSGLPNEQRVSSMQGYPLQWFEGYDGVILGDIHKQQVHY